jgi:hypothetical protein
MSNHNAPNDSASSGEEAELRALRRIASAFERDDIDELAAALYQISMKRSLSRKPSAAEKKSDSL